MDPVYGGKQPNNPHTAVSPVLAFLLLFLTACSLINRDVAPQQTLGHEVRLEGEGVLVCSQACQERGQCGTTTADSQTVILGGLVEPRTGPHDTFLPAQDRVIINSVVPFTLRQIQDLSELSINFYNVTSPATGQSGWVAGWCVAQPQE